MARMMAWTTPHDADGPRTASVHDTGSGERERPERLSPVNSRRLPAQQRDRSQGVSIPREGEQ